MDYEKKYKEALERARKCWGEYNELVGAYENKGICEEIFPELKESEDERIRGAIIDHLKDNNLTEWAAWLEKQGEQKLVEKPTKGNYYTCIKDYQFCEHDDVTFEMGKIYKCEENGKITAEDGGLWPFCNITGFFRLSTHEEITSRLQKPVEWSDEDEKKRKILIGYIVSKNELGLEYADWLNSLKDRVPLYKEVIKK